MLLAVAVSILAGATEFSDVPRWIVWLLAVGGIVLGLAVIPLAQRGIVANKGRMMGMAERMKARADAGVLREEDPQALLPESGLAGGKTLVFLGLNVWILYGYRRWVLSHADEPLWPYLAFCGICVGLGWRLRTRWQASE